MQKWRAQAVMLLAEAVHGLFKGAKLGTATVTEHGFHCDFDVSNPLKSEHLPAIEKEMTRLAALGPAPVTLAARKDAVRFFEARGEKWILEGLNGQTELDLVPIAERGGFACIVPGGARSEGEAGDSAAPVFRLLNVSGAYWEGNGDNAVLQRVHGVAFGRESELKLYLERHEEAERRDHRKLGKQLGLFHFAEEAPGMPFYLPNGAIVRNELENLSRRFLRKYGYEEVRTPLLMDESLWRQSGHWEHYRDQMYFSEADRRAFALKPMNCPGHMLIYKSKLRSYRELPLRLAEFGQVHRHEYSGALNGLFRVRTFCQDDGHAFVTPDQIGPEIGKTIAMIGEMYDLFGFEYELELSTRPADSLGDGERWEQAEEALSRVLQESGIPYRVNPGDGAFYGPKIDFHIRDALNRSHQCATIQLDYQMPEKFGLSYVDENNERKTPVVIHRAVYGSIDRFLGILIEHYAGAFPAWLAPVQVLVVPVADKHADYAEEARRALGAAGIRAETDARGEKLGYRIREAHQRKIPYVAVVGDAEASAGSVQVRAYGEKWQLTFGLEAFAEFMLEQSVPGAAKAGE